MPIQQNAEEFAALLDKIKGVTSILEIGSCDGSSLEAMAAVAKPRAKLRSIDKGWPSPENQMRAAIARLKARRFDAEWLCQDSHNLESVTWAASHGPFDFVFIDGDHTEVGVRQDWLHYGSLGKMVGFHDIKNTSEPGVGKVWAELCKLERTQEIIEPIANMGIGIVYQ